VAQCAHAGRGLAGRVAGDDGQSVRAAHPVVSARVLVRCPVELAGIGVLAYGGRDAWGIYMPGAQSKAHKQP
jgi:hypothetical protein